MTEENNHRPIGTDHDHASALTRVEMLMDMDRSRSEDEELDLLAALVEVYERRRWPIDAPDPIEAMKFRIEQMAGGDV